MGHKLIFVRTSVCKRRVSKKCMKACELYGGISEEAMSKRLTHHIRGNMQLPKCSCSPLALVASFFFLSSIVVYKLKFISELAHPVEQERMHSLFLQVDSSIIQ